MTKALMLQGTGSDVGKSILVAGLCRALVRRGQRVAPFKPQNMSNNAAVAVEGGEIGRAQWLQALAARVPPSVHMNPVLIKPESDTGAQIIVQGKVAGTSLAAGFDQPKPKLLAAAIESFETVSAKADIVVVEGAGSPAEVNLRRGDIANMGFALPTGTPVVLVGDIDRGGVIASIVGTRALLPPEEQALVKGFVINKFRGDVSLFEDGMRIIEERTGWRGFGIVPFLPVVASLPAEDAVVLEGPHRGGRARNLIVVPMLSRIANFDDADPLRAHADIELRFIPPGRRIPADADLVIIPGTKSTIADLRFLREQGWDQDIAQHHAAGKPVLGVCGGYQMLGSRIADPDGIEGPPGSEEGLGLLDIETVLESPKTVRNVVAHDLTSDLDVPGYEIHCGRTDAGPTVAPFLEVDGEIVGTRSADGLVHGAYVHGLFRDDAFRGDMLARLGIQTKADVSYARSVDLALDELADALERHLDIEAMLA